MAISGVNLQVDPSGTLLEIDPGGDVLQVSPGSLVELTTVDITLITSEHRVRPKFMASVAASCQPLWDMMTVANALPGLFDLDNAVGVQLDATGQWIGLGRAVEIPISGVFFSFDIVGLGFDQAVWESPENPDFQIMAMDDPTFRSALKAKAILNEWDGTVNEAYAALNPFVAPGSIDIIDNENMTITVTLGGTVPLIVKGVLTDQSISFRPAGVQQIGP